MVDPLAQLVSDGVIEEVVARLKSGKEADIYLVQHSGEIVAAKVYKERHARNFRNNAAYKEGRKVRNSRTQRAMDKGSRFGQEASEEAWKAKESEVLHKLHTAGVRVPQPVLFYEGVLLMEAVIDAEGHPAQRLIDAPIPLERAAEFYADVRRQMVIMLMSDVIHGDLSPYNVLYAWNGPTLIDFPQVVGAAHNNQAEFFFQRDLNAIRQFFAGFDPTLQARASDAYEIWRAYSRRELTADFVPTGKVDMGGGPKHHGGRGQRHRGQGRAGGGGGQGPQKGQPGQPQGQGGQRRGGEPFAPKGAQGARPEGGGAGRNQGPRQGQPRGPGQGQRQGQPQGQNQGQRQGQAQGSGQRKGPAQPQQPGQGTGQQDPAAGADAGRGHRRRPRRWR